MFQILRLTVTPEETQVAPGGQAVLTLTIQNASSIIDRYRFVISGIPADWFDLDKASVSLFPGTEDRAQLTLHPPAGAGSTAGTYTVTIQAISEDDPTVEASSVVTLVVGSVGQLVMDVLPADVSGPDATFRVTFRNDSNMPYTMAVEARDAEAAAQRVLQHLAASLAARRSCRCRARRN